MKMMPFRHRYKRHRLGTLLLTVSGSCLLVSLLLGVAKVPHGLGVGLIVTLVLLALAVSRSDRFRNLAFTAWVLAFVACASFYPSVFIAWGSFELSRAIGPLVQIIMFGMGMTLTFGDFGRILRMPKAVLIGVALQYAVMPLGAFMFASLFGLGSEVAAGLILIGSCPGGTASNVIAYIAGANVALSVTMTACSTLISPVMTPLGMRLLAGQYVPIAFLPMMISILKIIIVPIVLGLLINRFLPKVAEKLKPFMPAMAMFAICMVIAVTVALARDQFMQVGLALFGAAACHNALGYTLGYSGGRLFGLNRRDSRTIALEVGIQNGGMATSLAFNVMKSPVVAMGSAVFGPWSAVTSSVLASWWRRTADRLERVTYPCRHEEATTGISVSPVEQGE
jgi:BASS family bile acid:Na+ symporter